MKGLTKSATEEEMPMTEQPSYPGIPRWVKVSGIVVIVLILLVAVVFAFDIGGKHGPEQFGPGQHAPSGDAGSGTAPVEHEVQPDGR
jgi:hypothetical protein